MSLAIVGCLCLIGAAWAQEQNSEVEIEGTISAVSGTSIQLLNGLVVVSTEGATLEDDDKKKLTLSDLRPGMGVDVRGKPASGGTIEATRITIEDDEPEEEIEGRVDRVELEIKEFTIGGIRILWNADTRFDGLREVSVGDRVEVELKPSGRDILAIKISREDED